MTLPTRAASIVRLGTLATANSEEAFFGGAFDAGALSGIFDGALLGVCTIVRLASHAAKKCYLQIANHE